MLVLILFCFLHTRVTDAQVKPTRKVLILNEVGPSFPIVKRIEQGIESGLANAPYELELYHEYLDITYFPDSATQQQFRDFYVRKYRNRTPDVIITVGPAPLKFMVEDHKRFFPGIPVVFCLPNGLVPSSPTLDSDFTGVEMNINAGETLNAALRLQPGTAHVVVVGGVAAYDKQREAIVKQQLEPYAEHLDISYLTNLAMPVLLEQLKHLPRHTVVLLDGFGQDAAGTRFNSEETGAMIAAAANAPVFSLTDSFLGHGEVGGDLADMSQQGKAAGALALRILKGEKPQNIQRVRGVNTYTFDWKAMQRWALKKSNLPSGSVLINRQPTIWEQYGRYVLFAVFLLIAQTLFILALLWQRAKRRKTEARLAKSEEKFSKAFQHSPTTLSITSARDHRYLEVNQTFERLTGYSRDEIIGRTPFDLRTWVDGSQRVNLVERLLTEGSIYNVEAPFRRKEGPVWIGLSSFELIEIDGEPCVLCMTVDITERQRAEKELRERDEELRKAQRLAQIGSWHYEPKTDTVTWSEELYQIAGCDPRLPAPSYKEHVQLFTPESWKRLQRVVEKALETGEAYKLDLQMVRRDGTTRWIVARGEAERGAAGGILCLRGTVQDITERKRGEAALRESEERFRLVADTAPVIIWTTGLDKQCDYANQRWIEFTGRPIEAELGNGWTENIHPEDLERSWNAYSQAFDHRKPFQVEYRVRRNDGEYRSILDSGVPRFGSDGSFVGYIGSAIDVTERKLAEEALSMVSRRLIEAHEEERTRIARELHDDINQRLALLMVSLETLKLALPNSVAELRQKIEEATRQIEDLGSDVQALSHRLHSSKLEYLGLATAAAGFCRELSNRQNVEIDFNSGSIPKELPKEIALCLFRVLQEALQNAVKHSCSRHFEVSLGNVSNEIRLTVRDFGIGFDPEKVIEGHGLGLISIKERLNLVNGDLSINSRPRVGTTVEARIPLIVRTKSAGAGGSMESP